MCNPLLLVTEIQQMKDREMQCDAFFAAHIPTFFLIYKKVFLLHMQRLLYCHVCNDFTNLGGPRKPAIRLLQDSDTSAVAATPLNCYNGAEQRGY